MIQFNPSEEWKELLFPDKLKKRYAISNHGRIMSFSDKFENGRILKPRITDGYKLFAYKVHHEDKISNKHFFIRKLVAQYFLPPPKAGQTFVLLLDRNRNNNRDDNLKWATEREMIEHSERSPAVIKARIARRHKGRKLTSTKVQYIKQKLADPNRKTRLKIIAKQFGVTTMTLQRIKTGENWRHVKIQRNYNGKKVTTNR